MECFDGLFLCATIYRENLDWAAMRRFGLKIEFRYLKSAQSWKLFSKTLENLGASVPTGTEQVRMCGELAVLANLTPGDFTAARQHLEMTCSDLAAQPLLAALRDESRLKPDGQRSAIGFTSC